MYMYSVLYIMITTSNVLLIYTPIRTIKSILLVPCSWKIWRFDGISFNHQKCSTACMHVRMTTLYHTAKFNVQISAHVHEVPCTHMQNYTERLTKSEDDGVQIEYPGVGG